MLCWMKSHLYHVLQDALTSHLGLSNSSVSIADELAQNVQYMPLSVALVMIGSALYIFCIMYKVFNENNVICTEYASKGRLIVFLADWLCTETSCSKTDPN